MALTLDLPSPIVSDVTTLPKGFDLQAGYEPLKGQAKFHTSTDKFRMYSGGFGSGKSMCGCIEAIDFAMLYPNSRGLISRLRMRDLELTTMKTFWRELERKKLDRKPYMVSYNQKSQTVKFSNNSEIIFSGLDDMEKLKSMELSWAYVDEGSEVPSIIFKALIGRIRWGKPRRMWITTNPGAADWLKDNFVTPTLEGNPKDGYYWVNAPTRDNKHLDDDYIESMEEQYDEVWLRRYLDGDWDAFEGQYFTMLNRKEHMIPQWFPRPSLVIHEGWDFGFRNPTHITWTAYDPDWEMPCITFADLEISKKTPYEIAPMVQMVRKYFKMRPSQIISWGDPSGSQTQGVSGKSYMDQYGELGISIAPSTKEPAIRALDLAMGFTRYLDTSEGRTRSHLITENCNATWNSLVGYRHVEDNSPVEDAPEKFEKKNDHGTDSLGYGKSPMNSTPNVFNKKGPGKRTYGGYTVQSEFDPYYDEQVDENEEQGYYAYG